MTSPNTPLASPSSISLSSSSSLNNNNNSTTTKLNIRSVNELLSMIMTEVGSKVNTLDRYYSTMGVPPDERAEIFTDLFKNLKEYLDTSVAEAQDLIGVLEMEIGNNSREITSLAHALEDQDSITRMELIGTTNGLYPRSQAHASILQSLQERKQERLTAIDAALQKIFAYYNQLGVPEVDRIADNNPNDLSVRRITTLNAEVQRLLLAKQQCIQEMKDLANEILRVCEQLAVSPDELTVQSSQLNPAYPDDETYKDVVGIKVLTDLCSRRDILFMERRKREEGIEQYKQLIKELWDRLGTDEEHRREFLTAVNGKVTSNAVNMCKEEYEDILRTKAARMEQLILQVRVDLQELYNNLKYTPEQRAQFAPAFSNVFDETCLQAHEEEKARLEGILSSSRILLDKIDKREKFRVDYAEYELNRNDQSRFHVRGAHLILQREEVIRKQAVKFPEKEKELRKKLIEWETTYNQHFLVEGERYLLKMDRDAQDDAERADAKRRLAQEQKEQKMEERNSVYGVRPTGARVVAPPSGGRTPRVNNPAAVTPRMAPAGAVRRNILGDGGVTDNRREAISKTGSPSTFVLDKPVDEALNRNATISRTTPARFHSRVNNKENHDQN